MNELSFKQFKRTYSGGWSVNFVNALSGFNDFKIKNYTNFTLSNRKTADNVFSIDNSSFESEEIYTHLKFGSSYLTWENIDTAPYKEADRAMEGLYYKKITFSNSEKFLSIVFMTDSVCKVSFKNNNDTFVLASDVDNNMFYINQTQVNDSLSANQPHHFKYMFDNDNKFIFLFQDKSTGFYTVSKSFDTLELEEVTVYNKENIMGNRISIGKGKSYNPNFNLNTSFITYENESNHVDVSKSDFNLRNNFLIHNNPNDTTRTSSVIVLKNQMGGYDNINSGNNLLSGSSSYYVDDHRNYSSISDTIPTETSSELELNYVFYNKEFVISPGSTSFVCPSSMFPFSKININDTKFVDVGAFSYTSPVYADKVYKEDALAPGQSDQFYLCTWLSGSPSSDTKVWVDRYYYPDLITKENALSSKPIFSETYNDVIEALIMANSSLKTSISNKKFFDKTSDLTFEPNKRYTYERISPTLFDSPDPTSNYCGWSTLNYFKEINTQGKLSFGFYFNGDESVWEVKSDRNNIDSGIKISKSKSELYVEYNIFDSTTLQLYKFSKTLEFKPSKENFILFTIDLLSGDGYWYMNNQTVLDISLIPVQFKLKQLLYGDIFFIENEMKTNIIDSSVSKVSNIILTTDVYPKDLAFITPILNGKIKIDDMVISVPCGMRNNIDNISQLQTICGSLANKSNKINISIKNLHLNNGTVRNGLSAIIESEIRRYIPANTSLNTLTFIDYK